VIRANAKLALYSDFTSECCRDVVAGAIATTVARELLVFGSWRGGREAQPEREKERERDRKTKKKGAGHI
jgi:hypothetical protein